MSFFNHAARQASVIAFILPRSFRKASIENRLDSAFHLVHKARLPDNAFLFRSELFDVPAIFQIWKRRSTLRKLRCVATWYADFAFTGPSDADFVIQRVGARAGRIHDDFLASPNAHYFVQGNVRPIMAQLDLAGVAGAGAGYPSLAKSEIVSLYDDWIRTEKSCVGESHRPELLVRSPALQRLNASRRSPDPAR